jgi:hypothetical protein
MCSYINIRRNVVQNRERTLMFGLVMMIMVGNGLYDLVRISTICLTWIIWIIRENVREIVTIDPYL